MRASINRLLGYFSLVVITIAVALLMSGCSSGVKGTTWYGVDKSDDGDGYVVETIVFGEDVVTQQDGWECSYFIEDDYIKIQDGNRGLVAFKEDKVDGKKALVCVSANSGFFLKEYYAKEADAQAIIDERMAKEKEEAAKEEAAMRREAEQANADALKLLQGNYTRDLAADLNDAQQSYYTNSSKLSISGATFDFKFSDTRINEDDSWAKYYADVTEVKLPFYKSLSCGFSLKDVTQESEDQYRGTMTFDNGFTSEFTLINDKGSAVVNLYLSGPAYADSGVVGDTKNVDFAGSSWTRPFAQ